MDIIKLIANYGTVWMSSQLERSGKDYYQVVNVGRGHSKNDNDHLYAHGVSIIDGAGAYKVTVKWSWSGARTHSRVVPKTRSRLVSEPGPEWCRTRSQATCMLNGYL